MARTGSRLVTAVLFLVSLLITAAVPAHGQTVLVPAGSTWKYLDDGSDQDTLWYEAGFDDDAWNSGPAQLGYGDGDEATVVSYGPDSQNKHITTYFRHVFNVNDPSQFAYLLVRLLRDDGAVVHLNDVEIKRSNMPDTTIGYRTVAASTVGGDAEDTFYEYYSSAGHLDSGTNVLAVEVHQGSGTSSDISFDLELTGLAAIMHPTHKAPYLIFTGDDREMRVLWQLIVPDTCQIEWGLDTLYTLGSQETTEYGEDHQHAYTINDLIPSTRYFYRVVARADTFRGSFATAPYPHAAEAHFFAYGDCRSYPADHDQVAGAINSSWIADPSRQSLVISVGDLVSDGDVEDDWDEEFFVSSQPNIQAMLANLPYQACMGNHEGSGELFAEYFPYPFEADRYWSFDYGPAHFVMVDQYVAYGTGSAQYNWIDSDLASTTKTWKFICLHEPGWSADDGHENDTTVQNDIQLLCEQYGVSIVFGGHNHYYARAVVNGVQHITTGGGGAPLHTPNLGYPNIVAGASAYHYCSIEIDGGSLSFAAISTAGDTLDEFDLAGTVTAVERDPKRPSPLGPEFTLFDAFPNPFNPRTTIPFTVLETSHIELSIYDVNGGRVRALVNAELEPGRYEYPWDGRNDAGHGLSSGLYFYKLRAGDTTQGKKTLLLK